MAAADEAELVHKMLLQQMHQAASDGEIRKRIEAEVVRLQHQRNLVRSTTRSPADQRTVRKQTQDTAQRIREGLERLKREPISRETLKFVAQNIAIHVPQNGTGFHHGTPRLAGYPFAQNLVAMQRNDEVIGAIRQQMNQRLSDTECRVIGMTLCVLGHVPRRNKQNIEGLVDRSSRESKVDDQLNRATYSRVRQYFDDAPNQFPKTRVVDPTKDYHSPTIDYFFP